MSEALLTDVRFHRLLWAFDEDLAAMARTARCPRCGGVLHSARYSAQAPRPAGRVGCGVSPAIQLLLCGEGVPPARKTAASLRFLGRKVYAAAIVVLVSALRGGATPAARRRLQDLVGASRRTVTRWHRWWCETFVEHSVLARRAWHLHAPVSTDALPASLLERFAGDPANPTARPTSLPRSAHGRRCGCTLCNGQAPARRGCPSLSVAVCITVRPMQVQQRCGHDDRRWFTDPRTLGATALLGHRTPVGRAAGRWRVARRAPEARRAGVAAPEHR